MRIVGAAALTLLLAACGSSEPVETTAAAGDPLAQLRSPAGVQTALRSVPIDGVDGAILPSGRYLTPAGIEISVEAPKPMGLALSPDGSTLLSVNNMGVQPQGVFPFSATLIRNAGGDATTTRIALDATYMGAVFAADGARFYVSGGDNGNVWVGDTASGTIVGSVNLSGRGYELPRPLLPADPTLIVRAPLGAYPGNMAISADGRHLYVVDQAAFKLHVIDTTMIATNAGGVLAEPDNFDAVRASVDTGIYPYAVALSRDGQRLFVANIGMFRYTHLRPETLSGDAAQDYPLCYPGAGYPDETASDRRIRVKPVDPRNLPLALRDDEGIRCGYVSEAREVVVPAAGDPNAGEASSVFVYDLADPLQPKRIADVKAGARIGERVDGIDTYGGSHPNAIAAGTRAIYVSNGNHDSISVLSADSYAEAARIPLRLFDGAGGRIRGVLPVALALSADERRLYVAEAGINAIGVIALGDQAGLDGAARVLGHIPTGWWPSAVQLSADGRRLFVASAKGRGAGPSSGAVAYQFAAQSPKNTTIGTVQVIDVPAAAALAAYAEQVRRNNGFVAAAETPAPSVVPARYGERSAQIRHVVLINKENATHDLLLGHITQTRRGEPVAGEPANSVGAQATPNHTELALSFALSDNFYLEPVVSSDGHRWLAGFYPTEYEEAHWPAAYGQKRRDSGEDAETIARFPGRVGFSGANESAEPIDYNMQGGVFRHLVRNGRTIMNFGNGTEFAQVDEGAGLEPTGTRQHVNIPMEKVMRDNSDHLYPGYNTHIPDAPLASDPTRTSRFGRFKQVFENLLVQDGECRLADYTTLFFPNDHGGGPTDVESDNLWSFQRFIQDNDAALGLAVELISNSPCWRDTAIFVIEDDTQNGVDHVDGHRSILMLISPWAKREHVSHVHTSLPSVFKTIYLLLGVPPLHQFDAAATDLRDLFTLASDETPYTAVPFSGLPAEAARAWQAATRKVDFDEMDGDEIDLRQAIVESLGLPREDARPLHESNPEYYPGR